MNIEKFCEKFDLGNVISIEKLTGGLMHKMYKVITDNKTYAIKILNPEVMKRKDAEANFILSEKICNLAYENDISVSNALLLNGNYINELNGMFYIVFDFIDGKTLNDDEITIEHCKKMGALLSKIHKLDYSSLNIKAEKKEDNFYVEWKAFVNNPNFNNMPYKDLYLRVYESYYEYLEKAKERFNLSNKYFGVCHGDLDLKNVMWENDNPIVIDWESASISNTKRELIEVALSFSGFLSNNFDVKKYKAILSSYLETNSFEHDRYSIICGNLLGRFAWLDYNLKRSLEIIKTDNEDKIIAIKEVEKTIDEIDRYLRLVGIMYDTLCDLSKKENHTFDTIIEKIINNNEFLKGYKYILLNRGFTNKIYEVGDYIVKICIDENNEKRFLNEIEFYNINKENNNIPKLYYYDTSKKIIPYIYQVQEKVEGKTLYDIWHDINEEERKNIVKKIACIIKDIHSKKENEYDFIKYLKDKFDNLNVDKLDIKDLYKLIDRYFKENDFGLIHSDLHFDNIIINKNGDLKILDFERSMPAPIDYDFNILNICKKTPHYWASSDTDMICSSLDFKYVIDYFKEFYDRLRNVKYLEERLQIYGFLERLKKYKYSNDKKILDGINTEIEIMINS